MGGRFGKYGDLKRRKALQCGRKEAAKLAKGLAMKRQNRRSIIPSTHTSFRPVAQKTHKTAVVVILIFLQAARSDGPTARYTSHSDDIKSGPWLCF